ncbi:glycerol-3-phosphate acyltransferase [Candidatus Daviesbacteria bacterium]|nr:glycerol-3-phosphate acyltransferase [Candidatus Daviesbacteria bacterium]
MSLGLILFLGYLIGSLSPGYFFGQLVKHIDIREFGNKNTGATNTYQIVGPVFGILTGIFDFLKAPFVYFLAVSGLFPFKPVTPDLAILAGLAVVVGQIKPFYLQFKGGKGVASLWGLTAVTIFYTRSIYALALLILTTTYAIAVSKKLAFAHPLRQILKLGVIALPLGAIWLPREFVIPIIAALFLVFAVFDAVRFLAPKINQRYLLLSIFAKQKERFQPSGATLLFLSMLLTIGLFPKEIAVLSLTAFLLGDSLVPIGQHFLSIPLIKEKTLGGAGIYIFTSVTAGLFLKSLTPLDLSLSLILSASLLTAVLDQFSFLIDDNLLVPVGTALSLTVLSVQMQN